MCISVIKVNTVAYRSGNTTILTSALKKIESSATKTQSGHDWRYFVHFVLTCISVKFSSILTSVGSFLTYYHVTVSYLGPGQSRSCSVTSNFLKVFMQNYAFCCRSGKKISCCRGVEYNHVYNGQCMSGWMLQITCSDHKQTHSKRITKHTDAWLVILWQWSARWAGKLLLSLGGLLVNEFMGWKCLINQTYRYLVHHHMDTQWYHYYQLLSWSP